MDISTKSTFSLGLVHFALLNSTFHISSLATLILAIKSKVEKGKVIVNITLDEMAIRQNIHFDGKEFYGFVDLGMEDTDTNNANMNRPHCRNALVFMAVSLNDNWKVPVGYFLINSLTAMERASLLTNCIKTILNTGAMVYSITFDGAAVNLAMCKELGASFDIDGNFTPWLNIAGVPHKILVFLDACHMLKLLRNSVAACLIESDKGVIDWAYFEKLVEFQEKKGFRAGNKLRRRHINYKDKIMNVKIAAQTLSLSVAHSLTYLRDELKHEDFKDSLATSEFCQNINNAFDILNSKCFFAKYPFKRKLDLRTMPEMEKHISQFINYLKHLKSFDKKVPMYQTQKKLGFVGFIINLHNVIHLFKILMKECNMKYLLTYKLSQDHLEIFFGAVRCRFGANNNPSAYQFKYAYKRLITHHSIGGSKYGNCIDFLDIKILSFTEYSTKPCVENDFSKEELENILFILKLKETPTLDFFVEDVIKYIAGYIVANLQKTIDCETCKTFLVANETIGCLQKYKAWGNLTCASKDVIKICILCEKSFKELVAKEYNYMQMCTIMFSKVFDQVLMHEEVMIHDLEEDIMQNHRTDLIKKIIKKYLKIKMHQLSEEQNSNTKKQIRQKFNKLVLFYNQ